MNQLTLITPTSDRPVAFELCERWMRRAMSRYEGEIQWIVADDGHTKAKCTLGQQHLHRDCSTSRKESFLGNLRSALELVRFEKILFIEDDDWYSTDYLNVMSEWLDRADIVGEACARYYHLPTRRFKYCNNKDHASLCQTGIRSELIHWMIQHISKHRSLFVDVHLWKSGSKNRCLMLRERTTISAGIKGLPGTTGLGMGHRMNSRSPCDKDGSILQNWTSTDDANVYFQMISLEDSSKSLQSANACSGTVPFSVLSSSTFLAEPCSKESSFSSPLLSADSEYLCHNEKAEEPLSLEIGVADFETVAPLMRHRRREHNRFTTWFAAFEGEILIGCCALKRLRRNPAVALFFAGFVKPEYRRRGVYRALTKYRKAWAREHGVDMVVAQCNKTSLPVFERQGFEATKAWARHQPVAADLRMQIADFRIEDSGGVHRLREKFAPGEDADREHGGGGGLGFGLTHYSLVRLFRPQRVLVIGSRHGFIPACIASALEANGTGHLDFVDANYSDRQHGFHMAWGGVGHWSTEDFGTLSEVVTMHLQRSDEFFAKLSVDCRYGYVYLDGAHDFNSVKQDFEASAERLAEGGLIVLHDPLVRKRGFGVRNFVAALSPTKWRWIILPPWPGLAIVQRP